MGNLFRNFELDRLSFWLGVAAGVLLVWLLGALRPLLRQLFQAVRRRIAEARQGFLASTEIRLRNDILRHTQRLHLASPLFSLDEILIEPRLLAPPPPTEPGAPPAGLDISEQVIPYLPDAPEFAAAYGAPTFSLAEALGGGAHLALIAPPGGGKSVALAALARQFILKQTPFPALEDYTLLYLHAGDLLLPPLAPGELHPLLVALSQIASPPAQARLAAYLSALFAQGRVLFLLDGLDELPPGAFGQVVSYLEQLTQRYPDLRIVTTAAPEYTDGLGSLGFAHLVVAPWNTLQRRAFIRQWSERWQQFVGKSQTDPEATDPLMLNAWLETNSEALTPLELTLRAWAAYAGDALGASPVDSIEAYIRRMVAETPKGQPALEKIAFYAQTTLKPVFSLKEAQFWIAELEPPPAPAAEGGPASPSPTAEPITVSRVLPNLIALGLLRACSDNHLRFAHPVTLSHLAAASLASRGGEKLLETLQWPLTQQTLGYLSTRAGAAPLVNHLISKSAEPLQRDLMLAARWLRFPGDASPWRQAVMRQLARLLQSETQPLGLRARAAIHLTFTRDQGVETLFRQMLASPQAVLRQLSALSLGLLHDARSANEQIALLDDPAINARRAACLALVATGQRAALEAVAEALLRGDEDLRRAAAEALAQNEEEGHPTLKEGAELDDLLVRRAAIFGLQRVRQPWAIELLKKMQIVDAQWVVKNAAAQALDEMEQPDPRLPRSLPALSETPWLIAFAGERGIGISPGKAALNLVLTALKEGKEEQRLAALEYLGRAGETTAMLNVYQVYYASQGDVREAALDTFYRFAATGAELPPPAQFGLGGVTD